MTLTATVEVTTLARYSSGSLRRASALLSIEDASGVAGRAVVNARLTTWDKPLRVPVALQRPLEGAAVLRIDCRGVCRATLTV